jgi:integrase/recombinase XerD
VMTGNPALKIAKPKLPKRLPKFLEPHQVAKLLDSCLKNSRSAEALRNWAITAFLYGSGLRISEALGLQMGHIRYTDGQPVAVTVIGKGDKERMVPLSATAARALYQWLKHRKLEADPGNPAVWVATTCRTKGKVLTGRGVSMMLAERSTEAGLGPISPHKLRHSYGSALVEAGRSIDEVKELLGHSSIATTQIYVHASRARLEAAAATLPDVLDMALPTVPVKVARKGVASSERSQGDDKTTPLVAESAKKTTAKRATKPAARSGKTTSQ